MYETRRVPMTSSWQSRWLPCTYTLLEQSTLSTSSPHPVTSSTNRRNRFE